MDAYDKSGLEEICIESHVPVKSETPKAYLKDIKNLQFNGMPDDYINCYMARTQDSEYLMNAGAHLGCSLVDMKSLTANKAEIGMSNAIGTHINIGINNFMNCFINGEYMLVLRDFNGMVILRGLEYIGQIQFDTKNVNCKNLEFIYGRYAQDAGQAVYAVDTYRRLYRIEWQDIKDGKYQKTLVESNVENFYVDRRLGLATVGLDSCLSLASGVEIDLLTKIDSKVEWTNVTCISKYWVVSGDFDLDRDGCAIISSINKQGDIRSTLKLKLTSKGNIKRRSEDEEESMEVVIVRFAGIYALQKVYVKAMIGIMMAIEREGCCHLISVDFGRLSILQSIDSIVPLDMVELRDIILFIA